MNRAWALINGAGVVVDIVIWDGIAYDPITSPRGWTVPDGLTPIEASETEEVTGIYIGSTYTAGVFATPAQIQAGMVYDVDTSAYVAPLPAVAVPDSTSGQLSSLMTLLVEKGTITAPELQQIEGPTT